MSMVIAKVFVLTKCSLLLQSEETVAGNLQKAGFI